MSRFLPIAVCVSFLGIGGMLGGCSTAGPSGFVGSWEEGRASLGRWQAANLHEMRRSWVHESALPGDLVEARTRATSACEHAWREARKNADALNALVLKFQAMDAHLASLPK